MQLSLITCNRVHIRGAFIALTPVLLGVTVRLCSAAPPKFRVAADKRLAIRNRLANRNGIIFFHPISESLFLRASPTNLLVPPDFLSMPGGFVFFDFMSFSQLCIAMVLAHKLDVLDIF